MTTQRLVGADDWFHRVYTDGTWEPDTKQVLADHLTPGDLFIDVGAWIGPVTRWALDLGARVIAYEPDPMAFTALDINCREAVNHCAAVAPTRTVHLVNPIGDSNTRIGDEGLEVLADTPRWVLAGREPALIKIDVEGYETQILPEFLRLAHCPIWVAWHEKLWPADHQWDFTGWDVDGPVTGWGHSLLTRKA